MAGICVPIIMVEIPCVFEKLKEENGIDLEALGIPETGDENDVVEFAKFQIDHITMYSNLKRSNKAEMTIFWVDGIRFWSTLSYVKFDLLVTEKGKEYNNLLL